MKEKINVSKKSPAMGPLNNFVNTGAVLQNQSRKHSTRMKRKSIFPLGG